MIFRRQNSLDADVPNSGSTCGAGETRRYGKRGKLVKHEAPAATVLTLVSPDGQGESATTVQKDGVLCTKL